MSESPCKPTRKMTLYHIALAIANIWYVPALPGSFHLSSSCNNVHCTFSHHITAQSTPNFHAILLPSSLLVCFCSKFNAKLHNAIFLRHGNISRIFFKRFESVKSVLAKKCLTSVALTLAKTLVLFSYHVTVCFSALSHS